MPLMRATKKWPNSWRMIETSRAPMMIRTYGPNQIPPAMTAAASNESRTHPYCDSPDPAPPAIHACSGESWGCSGWSSTMVSEGSSRPGGSTGSGRPAGGCRANRSRDHGPFGDLGGGHEAAWSMTARAARRARRSVSITTSRLSAGVPSWRSRVVSSTAAMRFHADLAGEERLDRDLVGGVEPRRRGAADAAGVVGQAEAGEGVEIGRLEVEPAEIGPVDAGRTASWPGRGRPGRSRWAGACRAATAGRWSPRR